MKTISRTVWLLSIVSLFTDMASEMLYPVMPLFLQSIGYSALFIGILEGVAEALAGLSKGYFGNISDRTGTRLPFIRVGYTLSAISKPMLALFQSTGWIFFSRMTDRMGKGIRTGARDALLKSESTTKNRATIFGLHRSMDTLGAAIGPGIALVYLHYFPSQYMKIFLIAFIPGIIAIITTYFLKEKTQPLVSNSKNRFFLKYWNDAPNNYRKICIGLLVFALINSSDVFLLLQLKNIGISDTLILSLYIFYNLIYSVTALPIGIAADKIGLRLTMIIGLILFVIVYAGFSFKPGIGMSLLLLGIYGLYAAATEGIGKAWISNVIDAQHSATAIGTFSGLQSIASLIASSLTGFIWFNYGSFVAFFSAALIALAVAIYFMLIKIDSNKQE